LITSPLLKKIKITPVSAKDRIFKYDFFSMILPGQLSSTISTTEANTYVNVHNQLDPAKLTFWEFGVSAPKHIPFKEYLSILEKKDNSPAIRTYASSVRYDFLFDDAGGEPTKIIVIKNIHSDKYIYVDISEKYYSDNQKIFEKILDTIRFDN